MPQVTTFEVSAADDGSRLDRTVQALLATEVDPPASRADARGLIERGAVRVNGRRVDRSSARVRAGDRVEVAFDPRDLREAAAARRATVALDASAIAYEDDALIAVDKPPGLPTHATRDEARDHLVAAVARFLEARDGAAPAELRAVHRLDADTSGLVLLGKTAEAVRALGEAFARREVEKIYLAVVDTSATDVPDCWTVEDHLSWSERDRRMRRVLSGGDPACTVLTTLRRSPGRALVEARPRTGRTHQIRVHLEQSGAPIVGDRLYGTGEGARRLMLHATRLELRHPLTVIPLTIEAPPPPGFS